MRIALLLAWFALAACSSLPQAPWTSIETRFEAAPAPLDSAASPDGWDPIRVAVKPAAIADDAKADTGALRFRGGLELKSDDPRFGGLSDLHVDRTGRLLAITDQGDWFSAQLALSPKGELIGLVDTKMARMRGSDGLAFADKASADAEDLAVLADGRVAVSFERLHVVRVYDLERKGPSAPPELTLFPGETESLGPNSSFEALATLGEGLLIGSEEAPRGPDAGFWIVPLDPSVSVPMTGIARMEPRYGLVSLERLPAGDFLSLERFYAPLIGNRIIVRKVSEAALRASDPKWSAEMLADLGPPLSLDNFEGVAAVEATSPTRIYLISDDNFRKSQRTLLYAFDIGPRVKRD